MKERETLDLEVVGLRPPRVVRMLRKDQRFLACPEVLAWFRQFAASKSGPFLDIGTGKGALLFQLPVPRAGLEQDRGFQRYLENQFIIWGNWLVSDEKYEARTVVGNLPFNNSIAHLLHIYNTCPRVENIAVILEKNVAEKLVSRGRLGFLARSLFECEYVMPVPGSCFEPKVRTSGAIITLRPLWRDRGAVRKIIALLRELTNVRKYLVSTYKDIPQALSKKRIDELCDEEEALLRAYFASRP